MPTVFIVIQQNDNAGRNSGSRDDLVLSIPVVLTNSNDTGVFAWAWQFVDKPEGSAAALSTPTQSVSGFTPDIEGTYLIRLTINNGSLSATAGAAIRTAHLGIRIPAASENDEFDAIRGWASAVDQAFRIVDDGYGNLASTTVNSATAPLEVSGTNIDINPNSGTIGGGAGAGSLAWSNGDAAVVSPDGYSLAVAFNGGAELFAQDGYADSFVEVQPTQVTIHTAQTNVGGNVEVTGDGYFGGNVEVTGDGYFGGNVEVTGDGYFGGNVEVTGDGYFVSSITMADNGAGVSPANEGRFRYNSTLQTFESSTNGGSYTRLGLETLQQAYDYGGGDITVDTIQLLLNGAGSAGLVNDGFTAPGALTAIRGKSGVAWAVGAGQTAVRSILDGTWTSVSAYLPTDLSNPTYTSLFFSPVGSTILIGTSNGKILSGADLSPFSYLNGDGTVTLPFSSAVICFAVVDFGMQQLYLMGIDDFFGDIYFNEPPFFSDVGAFTEFGMIPFGKKIIAMLGISDPGILALVTDGLTGSIIRLVDFMGFLYGTVSSGNPILRAITKWNGKYYAVGDSGTILASSNGTSWTAQSSGTLLTLRSLSAIDGVSITAVGGDGSASIVLQSVVDGTWTILDTSASNFPLASVYEDPSDAVFRVVGNQEILVYGTTPAVGGHLIVAGTSIFESGLDAYGQKITSVESPTENDDASTKGYADQVAEPLVISEFTSQFETIVENSFDVPGVPSGTFPNTLEVGVRFTLTAPATATAIRFYKDVTNTSQHIARLWRVSGNLKLAEETFLSESASGWQEITLSTPVSLLAGTQYVVSCSTTVVTSTFGIFPIGSSLFSGTIGVYTFSLGSRPQFTDSSYFWVDIVVETGTVSSEQIEVGATVSNPFFTATYSRPVASASLDDSSGIPFPVQLDLPATSFAFGSGPLVAKDYVRTLLNDVQIWQLNAHDELAFIGPTKTAVTSVTWTTFVYYGTQEEFVPLAEYLTNGNFEGSISLWGPASSNGGTAEKATQILGPAIGGVITNADFEAGNTTGWTVIAGSGPRPGVAEATTALPHSGTYCLKVGGSGIDPFSNDVSIFQNFTVPVGSTVISLWVRTSAPDAIPYDWFQGHIRDSAGTTVLIDLLADLPGDHRPQPSGGSHTPPPGEIGPVYYSSSHDDLPWTRVIADLSAYAGQTVQLFFLTSDDNVTPGPSVLFIDDIEILTNLGGPYSGTYFGLVTADGSAGSQGTFTRNMTLPGGSGAITFDGYYRPSGSGTAGSTYDAEVLADSPYAYWKLDEAFGFTAADSSGHSRNASISGGWTYELPSIINDGGTAMGDLDGFSTPTIEFDGSFGVDWNTAWSLSYGIRTFDDGFPPIVNVSIFFGNFSNFFGSFAAWVDDIGTLNVGNVSVPIISVPGAILPGDNHVVAITCDGTNLNLYVDGVLVGGPTAHGKSPVGGFNVLRFGDSSGYGLRGAFDNFAVFAGTALSSGRVAAQYAAANGTSPQQLVIYDSSLTNILAVIFAGDVNTDPGPWTPFSVDLSALAGQTVNIVIKAETDGTIGPRQLSVDDFSLTGGTNPAAYLGQLESNLQQSKLVNGRAANIIAPDGYFVAVIPTNYNAVADDFIDVETGLPIGMIITSAAFTITNAYGVQIEYDFWRSEYPQLGQIVFKIGKESQGK